MWFCTHCRISLPATRKLLQRLDDLESKQTSYEKQIKSLQKSIEQNSQTPHSNSSDFRFRFKDEGKKNAEFTSVLNGTVMSKN